MADDAGTAPSVTRAQHVCGPCAAEAMAAAEAASRARLAGRTELEALRDDLAEVERSGDPARVRALVAGLRRLLADHGAAMPAEIRAVYEAVTNRHP